jgi:hypothetical protein
MGARDILARLTMPVGKNPMPPRKGRGTNF